MAKKQTDFSGKNEAMRRDAIILPRLRRKLLERGRAVILREDGTRHVLEPTLDRLRFRVLYDSMLPELEEHGCMLEFEPLSEAEQPTF